MIEREGNHACETKRQRFEDALKRQNLHFISSSIVCGDYKVGPPDTDRVYSAEAAANEHNIMKLIYVSGFN